MAIRYTSRVFAILQNIRTIVDGSSMSERDRVEVDSLLSMCEQLTQAGHLVACGRTIAAFETRVGMTAQQMKETDVYQSLSTLGAGDTITIKCPRLWFDFSRTLLKTTTPSARFRTRKTPDGEIMVTRLV